MKREEIRIKGIYTDAKGTVRRVLDMNHGILPFGSALPDNKLRYEILSDTEKGSPSAGRQRTINIDSFAKWAKVQIKSLPGGKR